MKAIQSPSQSQLSFSMDNFNATHPQGQGQSQSSPYLASPHHAYAKEGPSTSPPASGHASNTGSTSAAAPKIRRRNRMITSCLECRRRKLKCNRSHPCINCVKFSRDCVFLAPALDQASQLKITEIKEKVGSLERLLEREAGAHPSQSHERGLPEDYDLPVPEDEKNLEPSPFTVEGAAFDFDGGEDDDLTDLGFQLGKMRITDRIGGFSRPKLSEELGIALTDPTSFVPGKSPKDTPLPQPQETLETSTEWMRPGPAYVPPSSGFFFGQGGQQAPLLDYLPSRIAADRLIKQYFLAVHPIAHVLHRPTFMREYEAFWEEVSLGIEPASSVQAIVFATMFSGVVSMDESSIFNNFGVSKISLTDNFKLGTETALGRANFLRTTKVQTLQAFVIYLIPCCRAELSRVHCIMVGAAIRMAECMGLHKDGETYGLNPLETHIRRLTWHNLCWLDIRVCEVTGPRPVIRSEDFDCKFPLNIDDDDLHASGPPPQSVDRWTDSTFSLIRFEIYEMMRTIWVDRPRLEQRKISITAALGKIETFRTNLAAKYDNLLDDRIPVKKSAKVAKAVLMGRMHPMLLHRYHNSVSSPMPDRLRDIMVASSTSLLENAVLFETDPELHTWSWFAGALQQYHAALLLLVEVNSYPNRKEADRIWRCLDYIFECDPSDSRDTKARKILLEGIRKSAYWSHMRGLRPPVGLNKGAVSQQAPKREDDSGGNVVFPGPTSIGKMPVQAMGYQGPPSEQQQWAMPNASSVPNTMLGVQQPTPMANTPPDDPMANIDWEAFDALFPPGQQGNDFGPEFHIPQ